MLIIIVIIKIKINYFYNKVSDDDDGSPYEDNKNEVGFVMAVMVTTMSEATLLTTPTAPTMGSRTPSSSQVMRRSLSSVISQLRAELAVSPVLPELLEFSPDILTPHWPAIR